MPSVSKKQQKFMGIVRAIQKGEADPSDFNKDAQDAAKKMKKSSVKKYAKTKHKGLPTKKVSEDRDYKAEYKKFQSSTKAKKYRAELNKYNRQKGTYGNGDGKDASHKGGKIVGFEKESTNRGRAEKSRLKKEINDYVGSVIDETINENPAAIAAAQRMVVQSKGKKISVNTARNSRYKDKDPAAHKKAKSMFSRLLDKFRKKNESQMLLQIAKQLKEADESVDEIKVWDLNEKCWKGYEKKGMKKMFGKMYPNCVKKKKSEGVNEAKYKGYDYKRQKRKDGLSLIVPSLRKTFSNMKDLKKYIDKHGKMESVNEKVLGGKDVTSGIDKNTKITFDKRIPNKKLAGKTFVVVKKGINTFNVRPDGSGNERDTKKLDAPTILQLLKNKTIRKIVNSKGKKLNKESVNEAPSGLVKKAIELAKSMGGNMTGAIKRIEKMKKGLSKQKDVKKAIRMANESINEAVYKFRGYTNTQMDELDAMLARAGFKGTPDFNKMTWTTKDRNPKIAKIIKSKGGKKIKESVNERAWTPAQEKAVKELDKKFYKLIGKKGIEPYTYEASQMWTSGGFRKEMRKIFGKDVKESVNEAPKIDSKLRKGLMKIQNDSYKLLANYRTVPGIQKLVKAWMDGLHRSLDQLGIMKESKELTKIDTMLKNQIKKIGKADKKAGMELMKLYKKHWVEFSINAKKHMNEGTCGYGVDGELGEEPAGPHLLKKKKSVKEARLDAKQLLQQLGGNKFIAMTGAKNLVVDKAKNTLHMKIGRNSKGISHLRIKLTGADLYDMEFLQVRAGNVKVKAKETGLYADQLQKMFTKHTGMYTSL